MEVDGDASGEYSSGASSHHHSVKHVRSPSVKSGLLECEVHVEQFLSKTPSELGASVPKSFTMPSVSNSNFQDMVLRALIKTTASLVGSSTGLLEFYGEETVPQPSVKEENASASTWKEEAYHIAEAKRRRKPDMMRTSVGEGSDSHEDFLLPENPTPEQRALRTRRLNRWRKTRARYLTANRKALRKTPYVIYVDATSKPRGIHVEATTKPRGIHRHAWKAAVHGQCSRLDSSMENINHHLKQVVDSMWHALEREWEFQGFAHKAKEMFEKSATKYMRNRKMQLKYKCKKAEKGTKPDDVSETHWKKIQGIVEKASKKLEASTSTQTNMKGKMKVGDDVRSGSHDFKETEVPGNDEELVIDNGKRDVAVLCVKDVNVKSTEEAAETGNDSGKPRRTSEYSPQARDSVASQEEDVDSQIKILRRQLLWLESSKKREGRDSGSMIDIQNSSQVQEVGSEKFLDVDLKLSDGKGSMDTVRQASAMMKENLAPQKAPVVKNSTLLSRVQGQCSSGRETKKQRREVPKPT